MKGLRAFHCRAAWPPNWLIAIFSGAFLIYKGAFWLLYRHAPPALVEASQDPEMLRPFEFIIGAGAVVHVLFRLIRFHPACNSSYASWLSLSPWTARKPLPLGPIHPVWQDGVVLGVLCLLGCWQTGVDPALPLEAFGLTWLVGLTLLLAATKTWPTFFAMAFLWPSFLLTGGEWVPMAVLFGVAVVVSWYGTGKSLQNFPWRPENRSHPGLIRPGRTDSIGNIEIRFGENDARSAGLQLGWPFAQLSPKARFSAVSVQTSFWVSLLFGWWVFCLMIGGNAKSVPGLIIFFGILGSCIRVGTYFTGVVPSSSLQSRFLTGRWIVPGFDQVFVTPLLALVVTVLGGLVTAHSGRWYPVAHAGTFALVFFILLAGKPTLRNWMLTGEHRFPQRAYGTAKQAIRPV